MRNLRPSCTGNKSPGRGNRLRTAPRRHGPSSSCCGQRPALRLSWTLTAGGLICHVGLHVGRTAAPLWSSRGARLRFFRFLQTDPRPELSHVAKAWIAGCNASLHTEARVLIILQQRIAFLMHEPNGYYFAPHGPHTAVLQHGPNAAIILQHMDQCERDRRS